MTDVYGLIGWNIEHSLSPAMHNAGFRYFGIDAVYKIIPIRQIGKSFLGIISYEKISGFNVTIPHKTAIIEYIHEPDRISREIGAVNTVKIESDRLIATNTDVYGFLDSLSRNQVSIDGIKAVVIGAGGSARAVCYGLAKYGADIVIANRTLSKAEALAQHIKNLFNTDIKVIPYSPKAEIEGDILINATPIGTDGVSCPVEDDTIKGFSAVFDIVYQPIPETPLLRKAKKLGIKTIDGLEMLVNQAILSFKYWTDKEPPRDIMRDAAIQAIVYG